MLELAQKKEALVRKDIAKSDAIKFFAERGQTYKNELIEELEDGHITTYTQGNYTDLCRGPHLLSTAPIKAIKVTAVSSAYWRGDENIKPNDEKFVYWAEKAAQQGDYLSAFHLGRYYETKKQYKNASNWYKTAAELNIIRRNKINARNSSGNYIK